jgi:hypothetical protein
MNVANCSKLFCQYFSEEEITQTSKLSDAMFESPMALERKPRRVAKVALFQASPY